MINLHSFKENLIPLQEAFGPFYEHVIGKGVPGAKALQACVSVSASTKEITGLKQCLIPAMGRHFIYPVFAEGVATYPLLESIAGARFASAFQTATNVQTYKSFGRDYWTMDEYALIDEATALSDPLLMMQVALVAATRVLKRSPHSLSFVSGAVSSGTHSPDYHWSVFHSTVLRVAETEQVFNQLPLKALFGKVCHLLTTTHKALIINKTVSEFLMEQFYLKIFNEKEFNKDWTLHLIKGWEGSRGAEFKKLFLSAKNCKVNFLEKDFHLPGILAA